MSEDRLREALNRAAIAQDLLENPLIKEAYEQIESDITRSWRQASTLEEREEYWRALQANERHRAYFRSMVQNGQIEQKELEKLINMQEKRKRFLG